MNTKPTFEFPSFRLTSPAFFLLVTLVCSLTQSIRAQGAAFADRKNEILTAIVNTGLPTTTSDPARVGDAMLQKALAHYALDQNTEGNALVDSALTNGSGAMFYYYMVMYNYLKFGDRMSQSLKDRIKTKMTTYSGGITGSTQNHNLMFATAFTLAREAWPDATFSHGLGYGAADPSGKQMLIDGMKYYVTKGCEEADSYFYTVFYINCYAMIHEFSKDKAFANMARLTCDWFLLGAANNWLKGYMVSPDNRTCDYFSGVNECPQDPGMSSVCYYLYFGAGQPFNFTPETTTNNRGSVGGNHPFRKAALNCVSSYVCPDYIVKIAQARSAAFVSKETHIKDGPMGSRRGLYRSSYTTPTWGITGQKDVSYSDYYQKQMNRWFVRWVSEQPYSTFNVYMPNHERSLAECFGRTKYEQIMQHKRTVIGVTRAPSDYRYPFVYSMVPKATVKATLEDSGWLFLHADKVLIATKFARPYSWTGETDLYRTFQSDGVVNGYIVETADAADHPGATPADQLVNFKNAIVANTIPDFSMLDTNPTAPVVSFRNMDGDQMKITFSEARDENHVLNGNQVDYYGTWPLIDNPWAHQNEGRSILTLNVDNVTTTYNFDAWSRASGQSGPDLYPSAITSSQVVPTEGTPMTFTATIRNSGDSPSGLTRVRFSVQQVNGSLSTISTHDIASLATGASTSVTSISFTPATPELLTIIAEVDPDGDIAELEENNNQFSKIFLVERFDLALNKPIVTSSGNGGLANDGDVYTHWQSTGLPATLTVDLGAPKWFSQIRLSENPSWATVRNMTAEILTSIDGVNFTSVAASQTYSIPGNAPRTIQLSEVQARYVRLQITGFTPNNYAELARIQIYGVEAPVNPNDPPVIISALSATAVRGTPFNYQIRANNAPTTYSATGLPNGVTLNESTGLISGTPSQLGSFPITITATNANGTDSETLQLTVIPPPPIITSALTANGTKASDFSYQIVATQFPSTYGSTGLPNGLTLDTATGLISGAPTQFGQFNATISATNDGGTGSATLTLLILAQPPVAQHWDGGIADRTQNGVIEGGAGTWNASLVNWTDASGTTESAWVDANHAIFGTAGGTVAVGSPDGTAGTTISAGSINFATTGYTLHLGSHTSANTLKAASLSGSPATITSGGTNANGQFILTNPDEVTWNGTISTGFFAKTGPGRLNFSGTINVQGTYGTMNFQGGTTYITGTSTLAGYGFITSNSGTVVHLGNNTAAHRVVSVGYGSEVTTSGSARLKHNSQYDALTSYGLLSGTLGLEFAHNGGANSNAYGANTYSGGTFFTSNYGGTSTLNVHHDASLGIGKVAMTSNKSDQTAVIKFLSPTPAIGSLESSGLAVKNIVLGNASSALSGKWTAGSNVITLSAATNSLSVGQTIPGSAANGIPANAVITEITDGTTIKISENATLTKTSNTTFTAAAVNSSITIGALNTNTTFNGAISQTTGTIGGLTKIGNGILTLGGANTYAGSTVISSGTLLVNGRLASNSTTVNGGTIGGTGTIGGLLTVNGTLAPGTSVGTLNTSEIILNPSAVLAYELNGTNTTAGGGINDLTVVAGNLTLDGTLTVTGPNFASAISGSTYRLFTYSGILSNNNLTLGAMPSLPSGNIFRIDTATPGQVNLVVSTAPNTGTYAGWALANNVTGSVNDDSDNDGIPNGVEYGLNTNPAAADGTPGSYTGNVLSFTKRALTSGSSDLSYRIEVSPDLGVTPWTEVVGTNTATTISATIPTGHAKFFARLRVIVTE